MILSYDQILFDVLLLEDWKREAIYTDDKTTFLWWEHTLVVTCILNADATSAAKFPPLPFVVNPKPVGPVGAPGQVKSVIPKPFPTVTRGDLKEFIPDGKTFEDVFGDPDIPTINEPGFGSGGSFAPQPSPGPNTGTPSGPTITFPQGQAPDVPIFGGGDFGGKARPPKPPFVRFGPGRIPLNDAAKRNPFAVKAVPGITGNRPTVPATDVELRARLRRPRRQLLVWLHSGPGGAADFMLVSPLVPEAGSDAQHGPICTVLDVPAVTGEVSAVLRLQFQTWEAPALEWTTAESDSAELGGSARLRNRAGTGLDPKLKGGNRAGQDNFGAKDAIEPFAYEEARKAYDDAVAKGKLYFEAELDAFDAARRAGLDNARARIVAQVVAAGGGKIPPAADPPAQGGGPAGARMRKRVLATPALLSNRWSMAFGWNPDTHLRTQVIEGEAIFRMDVLRMRGLTADQLRGYIWHPIPEGYQRRPTGEGDVVMSEGGDAVKYKIVDDQVMMNFPGGQRWGCIHVDAKTEYEYHGYDLAGQGMFGGNQMHGDHK